MVGLCARCRRFDSGFNVQLDAFIFRSAKDASGPSFGRPRVHEHGSLHVLLAGVLRVSMRSRNTTRHLLTFLKKQELVSSFGSSSQSSMICAGSINSPTE